ncbi:tetratricopeptide repeat protein [Tuwongella immobilis]|uniref:Tetratricopeptide repeat protein n=1 Tax=Tuwongella immobilis TaxID=692036 RepID=A0A6C2YQV4_9BACT|nr:tetratricopeptide repeat protein [Tuwongella immobilis]VIP04028.1 repeat-containing protein : Putative uncharacterized protein OS=Rhodopirellula baltica (strain SH1) GN=RB3171 PE=4 SV=1: TPR_20: TPR_6 [Tuwongella immobilis]VTS05423.1 repeat-containing protein : Putative uncharacterized protein OS=Rhodopirellula baltica (strain SH1) GN=RB3171 PE=4 SV=1: TPR_20: TPR_6 [Tuwongella immobilis]
MAAKTPRMQQIEALLADDPNDAFLCYGLAMEYISQGDDRTAVEQLRTLIAREPYVPAYLMAAQALIRLGDDAQAVTILKDGISQARLQRNDHAASEMSGLLSSIE